MKELDINQLMKQLGISYEQYERWLADQELSSRVASEIIPSGTRSIHLVISSTKKVLTS